METLAYLHLAVANEASANTNDTASTPIWKNPTVLTWFKNPYLSTRAAIPLVSLTVVLGILGMAKQASAAVKQGDRGAEVTALQQRLQKLGYLKVNATGYFGPLTKQAVMQFQQARGLAADGVAGESTQASLYKRGERVKEDAPVETWHIGDRGSKVREIQKTLADQGYPSSTNGVFDRETEEAVRLFQQAKGLKADGVVGPRTLAALSGKLDDQLTPPETAISTNSLDEENENSEEKPTKETWKLGDRDSKVSEIQKTLTAAGLQPGADGVFDAQTEAAVRQFQRDQGLNVDGIVGPRTLAALSQKPEAQQSTPELQQPTPGLQQSTPGLQQPTPGLQQSTPELKEEPAPDPKKAISWYSIEEPVKPAAEESAKEIWQLGDRNAKVSEIQKSLTAAGFKPGADGVFDEQTQDAVRQFQQSKGLNADGVVGPRTLTALSQPPEPTKTNPWYEDESAPLNPFTR